MDKKECLQVRMEPETKIMLKKDAHRHEMTVSEYIRWLIEEERERLEVNQSR